VLRDRWVLAVAGTHGKTTTAGMATWILEACGYKPGFVIGGVPGNFEVPLAGKARFLSSKPMNMTARFSTSVRNSCITARVR
jgi:UDP-N-acetylmuramate-alanine ligase